MVLCLRLESCCCWVPLQPLVFLRVLPSTLFSSPGHTSQFSPGPDNLQMGAWSSLSGSWVSSCLADVSTSLPPWLLDLGLSSVDTLTRPRLAPLRHLVVVFSFCPPAPPTCFPDLAGPASVTPFEFVVFSLSPLPWPWFRDLSPPSH